MGDGLPALKLGDAVLGRLDTAGSELAIKANHVDTTLVIATDANRVRWMTDAERPADFPFNAQVGCEVVQVNGIASAVSPQTFTVMRGVNEVTGSWPAGTRVQLARVAVAP